MPDFFSAMDAFTLPRLLAIVLLAVSLRVLLWFIRGGKARHLAWYLRDQIWKENVWKDNDRTSPHDSNEAGTEKEATT